MTTPPRRRRRRAALGLGLAAVALGLFVWANQVFVVRPRMAERAFDLTPANVAAPVVSLVGRDGRAFSTADHKGVVLFINFWATWCPPCREEMPSMVQLARELERDHPGKVKVLAVSEDDGWPEVDAYFKSTFGRVPKELLVVRDPDNVAAWAYYCAARGSCPEIKFPETYIVDPSGKLVAYVVANRDWTDPAARRFIERLIGG